MRTTQGSSSLENKKFMRECIEWSKGKDLGWYTDQFQWRQVSKQFNVLKLLATNLQLYAEKRI